MTVEQRVDKIRREYTDLLGGLGTRTESRALVADFAARLIDLYGDLETEMHSRLEDISVLHDISRSLMSILDVDQLLSNIVESVKERLDVDCCSLLLLDSGRAYLKIRAASGERFSPEVMAKTRIQLGEGIAGTVALQGEPLLVKDIEKYPQWKKGRNPGYTGNSFLCVPMRIEGEVIGVINVNGKPGQQDLDEHDLTLLSILAGAASSALANARLYERLGDREHFISCIAQSIPTGLMALAPDGTILMFNRTLSRFFNVAVETVEGREYEQVLAVGIVNALRPIVKNGWETGLSTGQTLEVAQEGETQRLPLEVTGVLLRDEEGTINGLLLVFRDISESREITKLKELDRLKSNFIAVASHELRTPLTSIIASLYLLENLTNEAADPKQLSLIDILHRNAQRLLALVNDLLDLARLDSHTQHLTVENVSVSALVQAVRESILPAAEKKHISVESQIDEDLRFDLDREKFEQVLLNLVSNAIKFTPEDGAVTVTAKKEKGILQVDVRDTGIGIPDDSRAKIFDTFYQVEDAPERTARGTGLGLPICRKIVELHGGSISLESQLGEGTVFTVTVPPATGISNGHASNNRESSAIRD